MYCRGPKHQEPWKAMGNSGHCVSNPKTPVASFHLTTGHDFLDLHWLSLARPARFPTMHGDHLLQCTGLYEDPNLGGLASND
ncbi:hypothetical protein TNCV_2186671 [Trichonephila clavipes]|nr:hypothetical protein TNCV_2186671 [Trichonephila clavipes]